MVPLRTAEPAWWKYHAGDSVNLDALTLNSCTGALPEITVPAVLKIWKSAVKVSVVLLYCAQPRP